MKYKHAIDIDPQRKKAMRHIIIMQCVGVSAHIVFSNGILLTYLFTFNFSSSTVLKLLALPNLLGLIVIVPAAYLSDRYGKKRIGTYGLLAIILGFAACAIAASMPQAFSKQAVAGGIVTCSIGFAIFSSSWFALLSPIIPDAIRGRFFGKLRASFQSINILLSLIVSALLSKNTSGNTLQFFIAFIAVMGVIRLFYYRKLPELEPQINKHQNIAQSLAQIIRVPKFISFCIYLLLVELCTGASPLIFGLVEKDILNFSNSNIVLLGTLLLLGSIGGFYTGGRLVDSIGVKKVFIIFNAFFSLLLFLFLLRNLSPCTMLITIGLLTACFGFTQAAFSIAATSQLLALVPLENKSLSTALSMALQSGGIAAAAWLSAKVIKWELLPQSWNFMGNTLSHYDAILLLASAGAMLLTASVAVMPIINARSRWLSKGSGVDI